MSNKILYIFDEKYDMYVFMNKLMWSLRLIVSIYQSITHHSVKMPYVCILCMTTRLS